MATQLLIYETAVPVTAARHGKWSLEIGADYGFSRKINSVPLMAVEFQRAASEYPIVFAGDGDNVMPAAILGVRGDENVYVKSGGKWGARYIPAFVRRYPFVFSASEDGKTLTLCIDEAFAGFNQDNKGERLFSDDGNATDYVQNIMKFLQEYQNEFARTEAICKRLKELDLLEPMQAQLTLEGGQQLSLTGFLGVSRERLKALPDDKMLELAKSDQLEWIYMHLHSLSNFEGVKERLQESAANEAEAAAAA